MSKRYLEDSCGCNNSYLLCVGAYSKRGDHPQDEPYDIWCYYCSKCGNELQIYTGFHDDETKKLYIESQKYDQIHRDKPFIVDLVRMNEDLLYCPLEDKRNLINEIIERRALVFLTEGRQIVLGYKKAENK